MWKSVDRVTVVVLATTILSTAIVVGVAWMAGTLSEEKYPLRTSVDFLYQQEALLKAAVDYARGSEDANEILFIGDSSCYHGYDIGLFQRLTGRSAYSLGTVGSIGIEGCFLLLRDYLQHHPKPNDVILTMTAESFGCSPSFFAEREGINRDFLSAYYGLEPKSISPTRRGAKGLNRLDRVKLGVRMIMDDVWSNPKVAGNHNLRWIEWHKRVREGRGCMLKPASLASLDWSWADKRSFEILPERVDALKQFARFVNEHDMRLVIRMCPHPAVDPQKDFASLEATLDELSIANRNVIVVRPITLWYEESLCCDRHHLNEMGARRFTTELAEALVPHQKSTSVPLWPRKVPGAI